MLLEMNKYQLTECSRITPRISLPINPQVFPCKNQAVGWREVEDLVLWSRGWSGREREMKEGGEGVYIVPAPKSDCCVFSGGARIIRGVNRIGKTHTEIPRSGSSGTGPDHLTWAALDAHKSPGPDHPAQGRIIRTYSESSDTVWPDHPAQGRIIRPSAETCAVADFCGCFLSRIASHVKHFNNQKFIRMRPLDSTVNPILKFKPKIKIKSPIESTILNLKLGTFLSYSY